jgi:ferritin
MKKYDFRVAKDIVTYETIELTDEQILEFKQWLIDGQGYEEEEVQDLVEIGAVYLYDWLGEIDIETTITKTYSQTEVDYMNLNK